MLRCSTETIGQLLDSQLLGRVSEQTPKNKSTKASAHQQQN